MDYGIQLYSVRDVIENDMEQTLEKLSEMGYKYVEFCSFFGRTPAQINDMVKRYRLKISGTHVSLTQVHDNYGELVAYHKAIGNKYLISPFEDLSTNAKLDAYINMVNELQPKLEDEGLIAAYHNHSHEFKPNEDGTLIYPEIVSRTKLKLELDTYWAYVAGQDPVKMMDELKDRLAFIHIKDGTADGKGMPLGLGTAPVKAVYNKAKELGIPMVVESETCQPDGLTESRICINYLKAQE
jgi:sugar phosphate isomerase/epimerase